MAGLKSIVKFCFFLLFLLIPHEFVIAQSEEQKVEVGVQFSVLSRGTVPFFYDATSIGGGGRITFNLTKNLALEGEMNYFPGAGFNDVRRFQGQFGVKSGLRYDKFGVFGKVRPGFVNLNYEFPVFCIQGPCPPINVENTNFSLDLGGVVEFYPSRRVTVRFDVGDTIINQREPAFLLAREFFGISPRSFATHNLQLSAGVGFRF
ncbi:MAG TPA: outer membrane beta-barrel protein [Blastocatellia bacterium]|nr:outer membrane beta-barrel protein [Blastocatellia bacterium]